MNGKSLLHLLKAQHYLELFQIIRALRDSWMKSQSLLHLIKAMHYSKIPNRCILLMI